MQPGELIASDLGARPAQPTDLAAAWAQLVEVTAERSAQGGIVILVADNGPGVPSAIRERIFEPADAGHRDLCAALCRSGPGWKARSGGDSGHRYACGHGATSADVHIDLPKGRALSPMHLLAT
mgnify:CR=1 FL=1